MEGEALRDAMLYVAGRLDAAPFGPPDALAASPDGLVTVQAGRQQRWRRSIYALKRRTQPISILQSFDVAGMDPNCIERRESIVAPQALHLKNNSLVRELAVSLAQRIWHDAGDQPAAQVERAYQIVAGRSPTDAELEAALAGLDALTQQWAKHDVARRREIVASAELWVRESAPDTVYENDLVSVWSSGSSDGAQRVGVLQFDLAPLVNMHLTGARLELGALIDGSLSQRATIIPPGIESLTWNRFVREKLPSGQPLEALGQVKLTGGGPTSGYVRSADATPGDLQLVEAAIRAGGRLTIALAADEDGTAYRQDWDDGVHGSTRGNRPRLVVYEDQPDSTVAHRKALENFCHALFNSAAFLYID